MTGKKAEQKEKLVDFQKIGAIIRKNFIVMTRDKARILPLIMFPVFMILIFGFTSGNAPKHITAAIISYDNSPLSEKVQQAISNSETFTVRHMVSTGGEGKKLLDKGDVKIIIEIPAALQKKIESGQSAAITVIVDESDSSVANTARQSMREIISGMSEEISLEKIIDFQNSVGIASEKLQNYNGQFLNKYSLIISKSKSAETSLEEANKKIGQQALSLENSLSNPIATVAAKTSSNEAQSVFNQTFLSEKPGYSSARGQIASLKQSSSLIISAKENIIEAGIIAEEGDKNYKSVNDYQAINDNILKPSQDIKEFSSYDPHNLHEPLSYEEKPAYGTGKRTVDFLIPNIIALVIFQGAVMGMGRAVAGEKRNGSLTRVFLTPTSNATIILGTLLFYIVFEIFRSSFLILLAMNLFHIKIEGSLLAVSLIMVVYAGVSTAIGMLLSSIVKSEEQYMAVSMLVSMPTIFLGGAFLPVQAMPKFLQSVASFLPVTYAGSALRGIMIKGFSLATISYEIFILLMFLMVTVGAVFLVYKRDIE